MTRDSSAGARAPWPIPDGVDVVDIEGYPLAYRDVGTGPAVLLLHGSLGDYRSWALQVTAFARRFRVLAPSLRHYYPERWDGRAGDFSLARHAADVAAFVAALGLDGVHLLGHSRGGAVALLVVKRHPELLRSLILAEPRGLEDLLPDTPEHRRQASESDAIFAALHRDLASGDAVAAVRAFVESFAGPGAWDQRPEEERRALLDNVATAVDTGERPGLTRADVARFDFPVLLVRGARAAERYGEGFRAMCACNPTIGGPVIVPDAGHAMHRDNPAAFNAAVLDFVAAVEAGAFPGRRSAGR